MGQLKVNYRKEARDRDCQIRAPGCNFNRETTVLAHLNGGGMGTKRDDRIAAWSCSHCHDLVDGRNNKQGFTRAERENFLFWGIVRTQEVLISEGKL